MLPKIAEKYAANVNSFKVFNDFCKEMIPHIEFMNKYWNSAIDYRYKRSLPEWNEIVKYANETSAQAASKKYYGVKPDGKRDYLSVNEIKQKMKEMKDFELEYMEHYFGFNIARMVFSQIIASDPELLEEYGKMKHEYDDNNDLNQKYNSSLYTTYSHFKIIHYDADLYEKQKEDYKKGISKSKPDGRIQCRIKESEIPLHIREKLG